MGNSRQAAAGATGGDTNSRRRALTLMQRWPWLRGVRAAADAGAKADRDKERS